MNRWDVLGVILLAAAWCFAWWVVHDSNGLDPVPLPTAPEFNKPVGG